MSTLERWHSVPDAPDYLVSDETNVRRLMPDGTWRAIKAWRNPPKGYYRVDIWTTDEATGCRVRRQSYVHHLVALAFIGIRPDDHDVDHINGNRLDNTLPNLRYRLAEENRWDWHGAWRQELDDGAV